jgi:hypothetical protein
MIAWLDAKLSGNGLAQHAIAEKDARLVFGLAIESCVGIVESGGNNNGPLVRLIQRTIGGAEREPWCASLVQTCLAYAEQKTGIISPIFATEHCRTMWQSTPQSQRVKASPLKYAIVVWGTEGASTGHTGVVIEAFNPQWFRSVEGNTGSGSVREGDGVYLKKRDWIRTGSLVRLGFLKPF